MDEEILKILMAAVFEIEGQPSIDPHRLSMANVMLAKATRVTKKELLDEISELWEAISVPETLIESILKPN